MGVAWRLRIPCQYNPVTMRRAKASYLEIQQPIIWVRQPIVSWIPRARQFRMGATLGDVSMNNGRGIMYVRPRPKEPAIQPMATIPTLCPSLSSALKDCCRGSQFLGFQRQGDTSDKPSTCR
uniref:Uncharacterized protein n=1 Tax=Bionectria ochroleuca TaxID=29856 RepID=A0A8H7K2V0_BIOOC